MQPVAAAGRQGGARGPLAGRAARVGAAPAVREAAHHAAQPPAPPHLPLQQEPRQGNYCNLWWKQTKPLFMYF